jgi:hypothetical protein
VFWLLRRLFVFLLLPISSGGIFKSSNGVNAICYFVSTLFISWFIWNNRALMDFVIDWTPPPNQTLAEFTGSSNIGQKILEDIRGAISGGAMSVVLARVSILAAIVGISYLVLLQIQTAFSFLINRGRFDDALQFSVCNAGLSFLMILFSGGVVAAFLAPQLLWRDSENGNALYHVLFFVQNALYNTFWIEALKP